MNLSRFPAPRNVYGGMILILVGLLLRTGGSFGIKPTPEAAFYWIPIPIMPEWFSWLVVWMGLDEAIFRSKATSYILKKVGKPLLVGILGQDRVNVVKTKLAKVNRHQS
jgi:hypothetical protein